MKTMKIVRTESNICQGILKGFLVINSIVDSVLAIAYSPNGKYLAVGSADKSLSLIDISKMC